MMESSQKISDKIDGIINEECRDGGHDGAVATNVHSATSKACHTPIHTPVNTPVNTGVKSSAISSSKQKQPVLKRNQPEDRSPDAIDLKKTKDYATGDVEAFQEGDTGSSSTGTGRDLSVNMSENIHEINQLRANLTDITQDITQAQQSTFLTSILSNLEPLVIREVQQAIDNIISRLDFLEAKVKELESKKMDSVIHLEEKIDSLEQYSRRSQLLFDGIPESDGENTDLAIVEECKKVNITVTPLDIQRSHRLGRQRDGRPRPIIVSFTYFKQKKRIVQAAKNNLFQQINSARGQKKKDPIKVIIRVRECLTAKRAELFRLILQLKERKVIRSVWTEDGVIIIRLHKSDNLVRISTDREYREFVNKL